MEENNISDVIDRFSNILKEKDIKLDDYIDSSITNDSTKSSNETKTSSDSKINIDINTIIKFKKIADKLNNSNNPRSSLLTALKPFLSAERQEKVDQYIKIVNILSILEVLNIDFNDKNTNS